MHKDAHIHPDSSQSGFTLVELMVTLSIALILTFIAIPSFSVLLIRNEIASNAQTIRTGLALARYEAIKRNSPVQICSLSSSATQCAGIIGVGRLAWDDGLIVFQDVDSDRIYTAGVDDLISHARFSESLDINWGRGHYLIYTATGRLMIGNSSFRINHPSYAIERRLILNIVGRVRSIDI
ncbi:GspH/FimT family pseudopilin [Neptunomonas sp.]|uniref:GspH/FimT family pseudopilin n=1 Tax=Neptunomonas sp. TaxID=1971898 RepID=UPI0025D1C545|nr:GspH/FimT family pseudopilin [Neptunomonas sp.]